jgi:hypothetical protein
MEFHTSIIETETAATPPNKRLQSTRRRIAPARGGTAPGGGPPCLLNGTEEREDYG